MRTGDAEHGLSAWLAAGQVGVKGFAATHCTSVLQAHCHHMFNTSKAQMIISFKIQVFYS